MSHVPPILLGLLKGILLGGLIGGGLGFGYFQLMLLLKLPAFLGYLSAGVIGAVVGFVVGKPFWKHSTMYTPLFKAVFGFAVSVGLYALATKFLGAIPLPLDFIAKNTTLKSFYVLGAIIGIVYGVFVGIDDAVGDKPEKGKEKGKK